MRIRVPQEACKERYEHSLVVEHGPFKPLAWVRSPVFPFVMAFCEVVTEFAFFLPYVEYGFFRFVFPSTYVSVKIKF